MRESSVVSLVNENYLVVYDEIPFCGIGYFLIRERASISHTCTYEYFAYKLRRAGAEKILLGRQHYAVNLPASAVFGKLKTNYVYDMILMQKKLNGNYRFSRKVYFEKITARQTDEYTSLHNEIFTGVSNASFSRKNEISDLVNKADYEVMFAYSKGRLVGICEFQLNQKTALIDTIGVVPKYRGKGYSKTMLDNLYYIFAAEGIEKAELVVCTDNKPALKLYKSSGFKKIKTLSHWYELSL